MRYRPLGSSGLQASVVAFGAFAIGGWKWGGADEKDALNALSVALDSGINLIDTAPLYGFGKSEELVGKAIRGRRDKVIVASKVGLVWHVEQGDFFFDTVSRDSADPLKVYRYLDPASVRYEVEQSLQRLGIEALDLVQTHWQESTTPIADTMAELLKLKEEGKIRAIGVSNVTEAQLDEYRAVGPVDSDQEIFSMLNRRHQSGLLPYCERNDVAFLCYSPLARGLLTGKIGPDRVFDEEDQRHGDAEFSPGNLGKVARVLDGLRPVAEAHSITFSQLALAWALHQPGCTHVLAGARSAEQIRENAGAGDVVFSEEELTTMDRVLDGAFPRG